MRFSRPDGHEFTHVRVETEPFDPTQDIQWLLDTKETAEWLGISVAEAERLAEDGTIPARKLRGQWRFGVANLNLWAEGRSLGEIVARYIRESVDAEKDHEVTTIKAGQDYFEFEMEHCVSMEALERGYMEYVLRRLKGNKSRAAEVLGIDPSTLYRKLKRYGL